MGPGARESAGRKYRKLRLPSLPLPLLSLSLPHSLPSPSLFSFLLLLLLLVFFPSSPPSPPLAAVPPSPFTLELPLCCNASERSDDKGKNERVAISTRLYFTQPASQPTSRGSLLQRAEEEVYYVCARGDDYDVF